MIVTLDDASAFDGVRADLVARIRREIQHGAYETPEKWERALERLLTAMETGNSLPRRAE